ncbi:DNA-directed RNA polymerase subunit beta [Tetragenococcus koreensis]|uniref:DNA-directed RNA polymerase subunit beta n=1 Tax=Tetragenococcus koreensis TaxID=290335 RepID=A0AAN4UCH6_9ENTE|nr:DNA-directed RNA polymerase subunit beta [Tetragenococcus koreensis]MCF1583986.1 DNA-directed RNA polymerase subunit beta [Tetragenococcus koreensis]MCF1613447.1 DNA-directed RNA polymerase subunit beta [Tetragenococcus koreensis]MCF1618091.1 DNA-directed RNA polymerase subunit beta [Tetragenococcus koreensis]MCF1618814.1 DNA-directed RNA polymerase subunit beta [Tetragenococcus koreensis]MCF1622926.1 DNA-directed RNA polymerase subunit beta [Tetragenococcus koreensis]
MYLSRDVLISLIKILSVIVLAMLLFSIGLMIGYGVIGDGSPMHVFSRALWQHIFEFIQF